MGMPHEICSGVSCFIFEAFLFVAAAFFVLILMVLLWASRPSLKVQYRSICGFP
jgi:hypothetical protein